MTFLSRDTIAQTTDLPVLSGSVSQEVLGLGAAGVNREHEREADEGRDEGGGEEEDDGAQGDHAVHLRVQASGAWKEK